MARLTDDPYGNHYFLLEVNGTEVGHLTEVSGVRTSAQVFEIEEGGTNGYAHKRVGQSRWENLTIRFASNRSRFLQKWRDDFLRDPFNADLWKTGSIVVMNNHGDAIRRFSFSKAWPVSWEGPQLDASGSALAIESLELAHEGISVSDA